MVRQAVQQGAGQPLIVGEDLRPVRKGQIRCHNQAGLLIALAEEAKQMLGPHPIQGDVAEFVDNNQVTLSDVLLKLQDRPFLTGLDIGIGAYIQAINQCLTGARY